MEEAAAAWRCAKESAEGRWADARDAAAAAWLCALQQAQAGASAQVLTAQQRWSQVGALHVDLPMMQAQLR